MARAEPIIAILRINNNPSISNPRQGKYIVNLTKYSIGLSLLSPSQVEMFSKSSEEI